MDGIYTWDKASAEVTSWLACVWRCLIHESPDIKLVYDCLSLFTQVVRSLEGPSVLSRHKSVLYPLLVLVLIRLSDSPT